VTRPEGDDGLDVPRARLTEAVQAYRAKFGRMPPIMGIPSTRYPELIAELWAAVRDGVPRSESDIRRALGMASPPPGAEI
jgi:hypothetical protein